MTIIETAQKTGADLVVMSTHGRDGMDPLWSGSVVPKVSSPSHLPLLLVPISKIELKQEGSDE
jgi:nucleotide-binding universal stress UspA family protein